VEQALQPADELRLGDPQLGLARRGVALERQRQTLQLLAEFRGESVLQLGDGPLVDLPQPGPARLVERPSGPTTMTEPSS
jgi:hypothetical protein